MSSIQALREQREVLAKAIANLVDKEKTPTWTPEANADYEAKMAALDLVNADLKRIGDFHAKLAETGFETGRPSDDVLNRHTKTQGAQSNDSAAMRAYFKGGLLNMSEDDRQRMMARQSPDIRNAMSTTTGAEGGFTVATEYYRQISSAMKAFGGIRDVAKVIQSATGATMNFPTADATAEIGEIVGQNAAATLGETTFGNLALDVYKYSSKKIAVPFELIQDSMFDIESYVQEILAMRLGRITAAHFATGTGSSQPFGVVTGAGAGKVGTTGQTVTVTYDDLIDLEHSVDIAYRAKAQYMMNDASVKVIRKLKDSQGRPLFVPGYEQGNPGGAPDTLMGRKIVVCNEIPVMAASAKSILFGDFSKYIIRDVMDLTVFRMADSAFTLNGQVGFVAFNRMGGRLIDTGGAIKYYQNSAS